MRDAAAAARVVVVLGQSFPVLELMEATLKDGGHRALTTTKAEEVIELARSIRIDVLIADFGGALEALEEELRLVQPDMHVVRVCEPYELQHAGRDAAAIARPVSLRKLDAVVRGLSGTDAWPLRRCSGYCRAR